MKESQTKKFRLLLPLVFIAAFLLMLSAAFAEPEGDAEVFNGKVINSPAGAKLFDDAGTAGHNQLAVVPDGTAVLIYGEKADRDGDVWFKVKVNVGGTDYEGYLIKARVQKGAAVTPTPEPTAEPTQEVTPEPTQSPVITSVIDESTKPSNPVKDESAKSSSSSDGSSGGFGPWKWIIILVIVIIVFMLIYTIWVKKNEERLEREIERYSGKTQYEPLDGENEEDYEEAKANYYDHIGLGGNSEKDLADEIGGKEDVKLDMSGVFDDEPLKNASGKTKDFAEDATLSELIASLESKLGKDKLEEEDEVLEVTDENEESESEETVDDEPEKEEPVKEEPEAEEPEADEPEAEETETKASEEKEVEDSVKETIEAVVEEKAAEPEKSKTGSNLVEDKIKEADDKIKELETVIPDFVKKGGAKGMKKKPEKKPEQKPAKVDPARFTEIFEEEEEDPGIMDVRDFLETLREGDIVVHKIYGEGKVVDNTDSEIIQVAFGKNMRFLKKEKLVQKDLLIL